MKKKLFLSLILILLFSLTFVIAKSSQFSQSLNVNNPSHYMIPNPSTPNGFTINCQQWLSDLQELEVHCTELGKIPGRMMVSFQSALLSNNGFSSPASETIREKIIGAATEYNRCKELLDNGYASYVQYCPLP